MSAALAGVGLLIVAAVAGVLLKKEAPAFSVLLSISVALALLWRLRDAAQDVLQGVSRLAQQTDGQAFSCLVRCAGILLLTDYTRSLCEEANADSLAWCVGFAGRCMMLATSFPMLEQVCQTIWGLAG